MHSANFAAKAWHTMGRRKPSTDAWRQLIERHGETFVTYATPFDAYLSIATAGSWLYPKNRDILATRIMAREATRPQIDHQYLYTLKGFGQIFCTGQMLHHKCSSALEIGCGFNTYFGRAFKKIGCKSYAVDKPFYYGNAQWQLGKLLRPKTTYFNGYLGEDGIGIPNEMFDVICSVSALEHTPRDMVPSLYKEIYRTLKPGGMSVHTIDINATERRTGLAELHLEAIQSAGFRISGTKDISPCFDEGGEDRFPLIDPPFFTRGFYREYQYNLNKTSATYPDLTLMVRLIK